MLQCTITYTTITFVFIHYVTVYNHLYHDNICFYTLCYSVQSFIPQSHLFLYIMLQCTIIYTTITFVFIHYVTWYNYFHHSICPFLNYLSNMIRITNALIIHTPNPEQMKRQLSPVWFTFTMHIYFIQLFNTLLQIKLKAVNFYWSEKIICFLCLMWNFNFFYWTNTFFYQSWP